MPVVEIIPYPWQLIGCIPLLIGIIFNLVADKALKTFNTTVKPFKESTALVTSGIYGISRHPMYLGMVLMLLGLAILAGSLSPFLAIPVFVILMEIVFVKVEEAMLEKKFGIAWLEYKAKVRRWI